MNILYTLIINSLYIHSQTYKHKSNGKGCREKLSIYNKRLQNDEISYFLPDVPTCSVEMFKYIFKGRLVKHGTIREAYIRCVIGEVQK